jgi:hypothetical protein
MTILLASELAARVQMPGENPIRVLNRIRNWAKLGLLKPAGDRPAGGGRALLYGDDALLDAMILQLFNAVNIPDTDAAQALADVRAALEARRRRYRDDILIVSRPYDQGTWKVGPQAPEKLGDWINKQPKGAFLVISINRLLESVGR